MDGVLGLDSVCSQVDTAFTASECGEVIKMSSVGTESFTQVSENKCAEYDQTSM